MNAHVKAELKLFTTGKEKKFFRESYARAGRYRPMIQAALREAGLPEELSWLPLIESGYKIRALSPLDLTEADLCGILFRLYAVLGVSP